MSVVKNKRKTAYPMFVFNAIQLWEYTMQKCAKFPKRYDHSLNDRITDAACNAYLNVCHANSVYPSTPAEVQIRRAYLSKATGDLNSLVLFLNVAEDKYDIHENVILEWNRLIDLEFRLIDGVRKKDSKLFSS